MESHKSHVPNHQPDLHRSSSMHTAELQKITWFPDVKIAEFQWRHNVRSGSNSSRSTIRNHYQKPSIITSSTRTRRGGSCLKDIYKTFSSIELACAVHQPSPCVHALFESGVLFQMSHFKLHFTLHTSQITIAAWMQPLQYDLRDLAAKDNSTAQHQATLTQPLQCDLPRLSSKTQ